MKGLGAIIAGALALAAVSAGAAGPPPKPRWYVESARQYCTLMRETGGPASATVAFRVVPGVGGVQMTALDRGWKKAPIKDKDPIVVSFGAGAPFRGEGQLLSSRDHDAVVASFSRSLLEAMRQSSSVQLLAEGKAVTTVPLPAAAKALAALQACEDKTLRLWGADPAARAALKRPPEPRERIGDLISNDDYPAAGPLRNAQGTTVVRLDIASDGKVAGCTVVAGSNFDVLDQRTCELLSKRASFEPALGADGAPAASHFVACVVWRVVRV